MITIPPLLASILADGNTFFIDNSSFEHITVCPQKSYNYIVKKRQGATHQSALNFGKAQHAGLESRLLGKPTDDCIAAILASLQVDPVAEDDFRNTNRAIDLFQKYCKERLTEPFNIILHPETKTPLVELPFAVPLGRIGEINIVWIGKIDAIVEWEGRYWILDHKTTSILGPSYFFAFENSNQMFGYCYAASDLLQTPVLGAIINVMAIRRETKTGKSTEFARQRFEYSSDRISEWKTNTLTVLESWFNLFPAAVFPMHTPACQGKFGQCEYFEVCTLSRNQRETMLASGLYKDVTWSPLN